MKENNKENHGLLYNHSDVISGIIFFIVVFAGMAAAARFLN